MPRTTTGAGLGSFIGQGAIKQRRGQFGLFGRVGTAAAATAASVGQLVAQSVGQLISLSVCQLVSLCLSLPLLCDGVDGDFRFLCVVTKRSAILQRDATL